MTTITAHSWREGTYATTEYYVDGELFHTTHEPAHKCGVSWFMSLPHKDDDEHLIEDITGNTPSWLDAMIDEAQK